VNNFTILPWSDWSVPYCGTEGWDESQTWICNTESSLRALLPADVVGGQLLCGDQSCTHGKEQLPECPGVADDRNTGGIWHHTANRAPLMPSTVEALRVKAFGNSKWQLWVE